MSLIRQTFTAHFARSLLALVLVCALLATQFVLNRHVVEHTSSPVLAAMVIDNDTSTPDAPSCLTCLEHQAHGAAPISVVRFNLLDGVSPMLAKALPPNTPYLAPERARQRAPPAFS